MTSLRTALRIALLALLVLLAVRSAGADETSPSLASATEARAALAAFKKVSRAKEPAARIEAVRALGGTLHEKVAKRLLAFLRKERDAEVVAATLEVLRGFSPLADRVAPALAERLDDEVAAEMKRASSGDPGVRIDPRTGDADVDSAEGKARLEAGRQRSAMLVALLRTLDALGWEGVRTPPDLTPLLQDPSDDLVAAVLARLARTTDAAALPAVLALYRMYPSEASWETGAIQDIAGTNATAKAKWMVLFGHPGKQRARPRVHAAMMTTLEAVTGRNFATPDELAAFLDSAEGKRLARAGHGRH